MDTYYYIVIAPLPDPCVCLCFALLQLPFACTRSDQLQVSRMLFCNWNNGFTYFNFIEETSQQLTIILKPRIQLHH